MLTITKTDTYYYNRQQKTSLLVVVNYRRVPRIRKKTIIDTTVPIIIICLAMPFGPL
jgi:hypothetical protein